MSRPESYITLASLSPIEQADYCKSAEDFGGYTVYIEGEELYGVFDGNYIRHPLDPARKHLRVIPFDRIFVRPIQIEHKELAEVI